MNFVSTLKDRLKILSDIFTKLLRFKTTSVKTTPTIKTEQVTPTIKTEQVTPTIKTEHVDLEAFAKTHFGGKRRWMRPSTPTIKTEPAPETEQTTIENFCPKIISLNQNNLKNFEPGIVFDTNVPIHFEDFPELFKVGKKIKEKLSNKPIYILSQIELEFKNKRCPKNYQELVIDYKFTGRKRDFNQVLNKLPESLGANIYLVNITKSEEIKNKAQEYLPDLEEFGLHEADSIFLAFAKLTKSTLVTCDKELLRCCSLAQCEFIEFQGFLEKVCQPSPITKMLRDRRNYRRNYHKKLVKYQHHDRWGVYN